MTDKPKWWSDSDACEVQMAKYLIDIDRIYKGGISLQAEFD